MSHPVQLQTSFAVGLHTAPTRVAAFLHRDRKSVV